MHNIEIDECEFKSLEKGYILQLRINGLLVDIKKAEIDVCNLGNTNTELLIKSSRQAELKP